MSRYGWERGTITIPGAEWPKLKAAVRDAYNRLQAEHLQLAERAYSELIAAGRGKRNFDYRAALFGVPSLSRANNERIEMWHIERALFGDRSERRTTPLQPKKKDFPEANGATTHFQLREASIDFDEKARAVEWYSGDNNHQVERAHAHPVAQAFFQALNRVKWPERGHSGGVLLGNDEYNMDNSNAYEGAGGDYVTARYGPLGKRSDPMTHLRRRASRTATRRVASFR